MSQIGGLDHTCVWLSAAVEKTWDFFVGMVVLRLISLRRAHTNPEVIRAI